jgi:exonuclease SbcC
VVRGDLANLCLRLAISEVITERAGGLFNFIILDEIFGSQDMIRRQNIMKALNSLSSKFRQIFLITHIEDIKNHMENIILVSENESGISTVKIE